MSISTRTGDGGDTRLFSGESVSKTDPRPECYGHMDEASSWLGFAKALVTREDIVPILDHVQQAFFRLGHELATDVAKVDRVPNRIGAEDVRWLDSHVDSLEAALPAPTGFVVPGRSPAHGALHIARTVVRRTERAAVGLRERGLLKNADLVRYLNRLSDLVWLLAEYEVTPEVSISTPTTNSDPH